MLDVTAKRAGQRRRHESEIRVETLAQHTSELAMQLADSKRSPDLW
jgi:hypothetical protein